MSKHETLPVLPLRTAVLFPGQAIPVVVGRPGTVKAVEAALKGEGRVLAVAQRDDSEDAQPDNLYTMGVVASLGPIKRGLNGMQLVLKGDARATTLNYRTREDHLAAATLVVEELPPLDAEDPAFVGLYRETRERAMELGQLRGVPDEVLKQVLDGITEPGPFIDQIAGYLELPVSEKQLLLETLGVEERMRKVLVHLQRHIGMFKAQAQIQSQVQEELGERQREMYLREQLKAIQKELGEGDESERELEQLRERLEALVLPQEARAEVNRELARLERAGPQSMDAQVVRTYLEWVAELPWNEHSDDNLDLPKATTILDEDHYGLQDVKDRILEFLAVRQLRAKQVAEEGDKTRASESSAATPEAAAPEAGVSPDAVTEPGDTASVKPARKAAEAGDERKAKARALAKGPILLFTGPPGVGKTSIAKSIARSLGRKYVRMALGGARDEADIRGHRRTYVGAMPGRIIQGMKQAGTKNPVFLLDEVDKLGVSFQGDPASALLEVLDPAQNDTFTDHYLNVPFDLSEVLFIATANFLQNIPGPLLDRMEVVEFSGYTEREKVEIAKKYLVPRQLEENGLAGKDIRFTDGAAQAVVSQYTRESGVRQLEREIGKIARKIARKIAGGEEQYTEVTEEVVRELLGRPKVRPERAAEENLVGAATGMYYTPAGGDIMFVEASMRELQSAPQVDDGGGSRERVGLGNVSLILTGQLGEVMKESARAALTYATTHAEALGIPKRLGPVEVHIHVPAGAIPKDGPSAGVTMATALASAMSGRPTRRDVAMTGEITLRGRVLPIGGVKEKVLGAHRAGIKQVILPADNEADLEDIPEEVRSALQFHIVDTLDELLEIALMPVSSPAVSRPVSGRGDDFVV